MGFVSGVNASTPDAVTGEGIVTEVTGTSLTIDVSSGSFVDGAVILAEDNGPNKMTWTYSGWVKIGNVDAEANLLRVDTDVDGTSNTTDFNIYQNKIVFIADAAFYGSIKVISEEMYFDTSVWNHIVLAYDSTKIYTKDRVKIYLNGNLITNFAAWSKWPVRYAETYFNSTKKHFIATNASANSAWLSGHLTDINFIDGVQASPLEFASNTDGYWKPKRYNGRYGRFGWHLMGGDISQGQIGLDDSPNDNDWTEEGFNNDTITPPFPPSTQFKTVKWLGNGSTRTIGGFEFEPGFVWYKQLDGASSHGLFDVSRGVSKYLSTNSDNAEQTISGVNSFALNSFNVGSDPGGNALGGNWIGWVWANPADEVADTDGNLNAQVRANTAGGFSIIRYTGTGNGTNSASSGKYGHGLSQAPEFIMTKRLSGANGWPTWHAGAPNGAMNIRNNTGLDTSSFLYNQSPPDSNFVYIGNNPEINGNGSNYVSYCWHSVPGYSKVGTYTGTGGSDLKVYTGFRPSFILIKSTVSTQEWIIKDEAMGEDSFLITYEYASKFTGRTVTFVDDGFLPAGNSGATNWNGYDYTYIAFAQNPSEGLGDEIRTDSPNKLESVDDILGGETVGNYATWNYMRKDASINLSNASLTATCTATWRNIIGTIGAISGKYYYELSDFSGSFYFGIAEQTVTTDSGSPSTDGIVTMSNSGYVGLDGTTHGSVVSGDVIGLYVDLDARTVAYYTNGVLNASFAYTVDNGTMVFPFLALDNGATATINFGSKPFEFEDPASDFKTLSTTNIATPLVIDGTAAMKTVTYTGSGDDLAIDVGFQPDFVWIKSRERTRWHNLFDSVRGADKALYSNAANTETGPHNPQRLSAFTSDGFNLGSNTDCNEAGIDYVAWCWKANGSATTNVNGSIISTVNANPNLGFSVVTYTGTGSNATVGHGLGAPAKFIIAKSRSGPHDWSVYHAGVQDGVAAYNGKLNSFGPFQDDVSIWQDVPPSSTYFAVGTDTAINGSNHNIVAYCWSEIPGYSSMNYYIGDGSEQLVNCGFRPSFVLIKVATAQNANWYIYDNERGPSMKLNPNTDSVEAKLGGGNYSIRMESSGFVVTTTNGDINGAGIRYAYVAFAERPFGF